MIFPLEPEQQTGAAFLAERRVAMLADRVGFGKSGQFVRACDIIQAQKITVLCPPVLPENERAEFEKWALFGWPIQILKSGKDEIEPSGVVICNYALAGMAATKAKLRKRGCDALILDESHHVKSHNGARTKAIFNKDGIASTAKHIWFITGTPTPNHAGEWYVFAKVCGIWTRGYWDFVDRYCVTIDGHFGKKIIGSRPENRAELLAMLAPYVMARDKVEPGRSPLTIDTVCVEGHRPDFASVPPETLQSIQLAIESGDWSTVDGASVSTVQRIIGTAKAKQAAELAVYELQNGVDRMLIGCQHRDVIDITAATLKAAGVPTGVVDGRTTDSERESIITDFEPGATSERFRVCIAQRQALKEGRTMTRATRVLLFEPAWTPDDNKQFIARAWRRGQTEPVHASFLHLPGSIDEALARTLARKETDIEQISVRS